MYLTWKVVHVIGVVLFLGNIITGVFWKYHAERTNDHRVIGMMFEGIARSDRFFTIPGVMLILVSGVFAARDANYSLLGTGWIAWSIMLFIVSGVLFMAKIGPLQKRIARLAQDAATADRFDWAQYKSMARSWEIWGAIATLTPLAALVIMVLKPNLPGV